MNVIINMPMPNNCHACLLSMWIDNEYWCPYNNCTVDGNGGDKQRMIDCPLEPYREEDKTE